MPPPMGQARPVFRYDRINYLLTEVYPEDHPRCRQPCNTIRIIGCDQGLHTLMGPKPRHADLIVTDKFYFQGGITFLGRDLYITSAPLHASDPRVLPHILISRVKLDRRDVSDNDNLQGTVCEVSWSKLRSPNGITMPSGLVAIGEDAIFAAQGNLEPGSAGIYNLNVRLASEPIVTSFQGRPFNSPHGLAVEFRGSGGGGGDDDDDPSSRRRRRSECRVWFTDPSIGFEGDFRGEPELPPHVYVVDLATKRIRAMADGFTRPTAVAVDAERATVYVCDAGAASKLAENTSRVATVYAFDYDRQRDFLTNRRLFAYVRKGVPNDIKCDTKGNVFVAAGDGIEMFDQLGTLLGVIETPDGVHKFCFGEKTEIFLCTGKSLLLVAL